MTTVWTGPLAMLTRKMRLQSNRSVHKSISVFLILLPDNHLRVYPFCGTFLAVQKSMDRDPQTDYEFQLWTQANHLTGIVTSLLDALKTSFGLLLVAKPVLPEDSRLDSTLENFKRIIAAGEKAAKGFGIDLPEEVYSFSRELEEKVKHHTAELEKRTRQLVEAERLCALGEMANMIAHELRNSLMVIGGFAKRLYENSKNAPLNKEHLKIIVDEVKILEDKVLKISKTREMESSN